MSYGAGRGGRGRRHRWMFNLTGLPGWMRFGFSPGWVGRSPTGLPPTAQWLISSGLMPQFQEYLQSMLQSQGGLPGSIPPVGQPPDMSETPNMPFTPFTQVISKEQEIQMLEQQMDFLRQQLERIQKRLKELTGDE